MKTNHVYEKESKTYFEEEEEEEEESSHVYLNYFGYSDAEKNEGCLGHRRDTKCYRCLKCFHWCYPLSVNCYHKIRFTFRRWRSRVWNTFSGVLKVKALLLTVIAYVLLSALCSVLQIRIYKQLLIYAFVHEIIITTALQCAFIVPILVTWGCWSKCRSIYNEKVKQQQQQLSNKDTDNETWIKLKINVDGSDDNDDGGGDGDENNVVVVQSDDGSRASKKNAPTILPDRFTITDAKFYGFVSFFSFVAGGFKVLPIMILPSMLMILMDQLGLAFMMAISFFYLGKKYDKVQFLCIVLVALGVVIELIPDYEESLGFAKNVAHDFFWRNTLYHDYNASTNHMYHFKGHADLQQLQQQQQQQHGESTVLFREHFINASLFDLSQCLKTHNVSLDNDEKYSYSFYQEALENKSLAWWRSNNIAFLICIFLAISSLIPDCMSYAVVEKFWRLRDAIGGPVDAQSSHHACNQRQQQQQQQRQRQHRRSSVEVAAKIIAFKLVWIFCVWPFFYLPNSNLGGYHYLKYGSYCSFDNLFYDAHGVIVANATSDVTIVGTDKNATFAAKITSIRLDGDYVNENVHYPPHPLASTDNVITAYWECSPWRNGISCENMLQLTMLYCLVDFLQYVLHVKIIRDTTNANLAWLLGIVRIGISDIMFSVPLIAGRVFSEFRYYDILSLLLIICATLIFWLHRYKQEDEKEEEKNEEKNDKNTNNATTPMGMARLDKKNQNMLTKVASLYESNRGDDFFQNDADDFGRHATKATKKTTTTTTLVLKEND